MKPPIKLRDNNHRILLTQTKLPTERDQIDSIVHTHKPRCSSAQQCLVADIKLFRPPSPGEINDSWLIPGIPVEAPCVAHLVPVDVSLLLLLLVEQSLWWMVMW